MKWWQPCSYMAETLRKSSSPEPRNNGTLKLQASQVFSNDDPKLTLDLALKPQGPWWQYFIFNLLRLGEQKFIRMVSVCWPRWPPCPYILKILRKSSSLEPRIMESWNFIYKALMTWGLPSLFKWWSQVDFCFYLKKFRFTFLCIYKGKILISQFFKNCWWLMYHIWHRYLIN